jgi:hypothetical protein
VWIFDNASSHKVFTVALFVVSGVQGSNEGFSRLVELFT